MIPPVPLRSEQLVDGKGSMASNWFQFLEGLWRGDKGNDWTPTYSGLTETGAATHTARYFRVSASLYYVRIRVVPSTDTSSTAATTYLSNFPLTVPAMGTLQVLNETTLLPIGVAVVSTNGRIYPPTWTTVTAPITICGMIEAS